MRINGISYCEISEAIGISENSARVIEIDDEKVVSIITKKLFIVSSALLFIGAFIGMALKKNTSIKLK